MSIYILYHRGTLGHQSWHDVQTLHATEDMGVWLNVSTGVSHWTEKAAARGPPEARLMRYGTSTSPVDAGPVHSITRALHRVVTVGRPTGRSQPPCDEPSTPGCGSSVLPTPEHRRTPETAGQSVVLHAPVISSVHRTPHHMMSCGIGNPESPALTVETPVSHVGRNERRMVRPSGDLSCPV